MHIILVPDRLATARTLTLTPQKVFFVAVLLIFLICSVAALLAWAGGRFNLLSFVGGEGESAQQRHDFKAEEYLRDNIKTMAAKMGEMQAELVRLDLLGERISKQTGIPLPKNETLTKPLQSAPKPEKKTDDGTGGPLVGVHRQPTLTGLQIELDRLATALAERLESLTALESQLMERRVKTTLLPTLQPISNARIGSPFGLRTDPILGVSAMHEGMDFSAPSGTRVVAAAGGVVTMAERHSAYGNLVEIDHGNDFSSRYAHLSQIDVVVGQIVKRGQAIALSGNTGRSTGPHLHFEVRYRGVAQDPARFLKMGGDTQLAQHLDKLDLLKPNTEADEKRLGKSARGKKKTNGAKPSARIENDGETRIHQRFENKS